MKRLMVAGEAEVCGAAWKQVIILRCSRMEACVAHNFSLNYLRDVIPLFSPSLFLNSTKQFVCPLEICIKSACKLHEPLGPPAYASLTHFLYARGSPQNLPKYVTWIQPSARAHLRTTPLIPSQTSLCASWYDVIHISCHIFSFYIWNHDNWKCNNAK